MSGVFYPCVLEKAGEYWVARFPDFPDAFLFEGCEQDDALWNARDTLSGVLISKYLSGEKMPHPSPIKDGQFAVASPYLWFRID